MSDLETIEIVDSSIDQTNQIHSNAVTENLNTTTSSNRNKIVKFFKFLYDKFSLIKFVLFCLLVLQITLLSLYKPLEEELLICVEENSHCMLEDKLCTPTCEANTYDANMAYNVGLVVCFTSYLLVGFYNPFSILCTIYQLCSSLAAFIINFRAEYFVPRSPLQWNTFLWTIGLYTYFIVGTIIFVAEEFYGISLQFNFSVNRFQFNERLDDTVTLTEEQKKETCSICLVPLEDSKFTKIKTCNHLFHKNCIKTYIKNHKGTKCPLCRTSIYEEVTVV